MSHKLQLMFEKSRFQNFENDTLGGGQCNFGLLSLTRLITCVFLPLETLIFEPQVPTISASGGFSLQRLWGLGYRESAKKSPENRKLTKKSNILPNVGYFENILVPRKKQVLLNPSYTTVVEKYSGVVPASVRKEVP